MKENAVEQYRLLDSNVLARNLGCSLETTQNNLRRNPSAVERRLVVTGGQLLRWRLVDVVGWLTGRVEKAEK